MTGALNKHTASAMYRNQWSELDPPLQGIYGFYNTRLGTHHGVGISGESLRINFSQRSMISAQYSYQIQLKKRRQFNIGIAPTYGSYAIDGDWISPQGVDDPAIPINGRNNHFLIHSGLSFTSSFADFGLSVRNIPLISDADNDYNFAPHYYGHLTLKLDIGSRSNANNDYKLYLDFLGASDAVMSVFQANARLILFEKLNLFAGYRTSNGLLVGTGWEIKKRWRTTYSMQVTKTDAFDSSLLTHEFSLLFKIDHE